MAAPNNIVIKTEPTTTEPAISPDEIIVKPEPTSPSTTRRVPVLDFIASGPEPAMLHIIAAADVRQNIVVKLEPTSSKRARLSPTKLYTQLQALGDRGGFITNSEEFDCIICMATIEVGDGVRLRECLHEFCVNCTKNAILLSEEAEIPCPFGDGTIKCESKILDLEIRAILSDDDYQKYLSRSLRIAEGTIQNTVHCKVTNCDGWCICDDNVNQFACPKCDTINCVSCQVRSIRLRLLTKCAERLFSIFDYRQFTLTATVNNIRMISNTPIWIVTRAARSCTWTKSLRKIWAWNVPSVRFVLVSAKPIELNWIRKNE